MTFVNLYPPFLGMNIRVTQVLPPEAPGGPAITARMGLTWHNRNLFGTQFGGALYAMCDPFYAFLLLQQLGSDYIVWDKAASIQFLKPGRGAGTAVFHIPPETLAQIRAEVETHRKTEPVFIVDVKDDASEVIARVEKRLYVRRKREQGQKPRNSGVKLRGFVIRLERDPAPPLFSGTRNCNTTRAHHRAPRPAPSG
jgi:acyl-coenzyme A thioesterase PaaI-like protein